MQFQFLFQLVRKKLWQIKVTYDEITVFIELAVPIGP